MLEPKLFFKAAVSAFYLLLVLSAGCASSSKNEGVHPDPDRFPPDSLIDYTVTVSGGKNTTPLPHFFHPDSLITIATIGNDSSLADKYYDKPQSVDIDSEGFIYITQEHSNTIRVYNTKGQFEYSIGGIGRGPGEFIRVISFAFDNNYQSLYVMDWMKIEVFTRSVGRFKYDKTIQHKLIQVFDMCVLDDALFISGYGMAREDTEAYEAGDIRRGKARVTAPINKFSLETLEHVKSFGFEYESFSGWGNYNGRLSETMLSCNDSTDTVVGFLKHYPYIFGYNKEGQRKWASKINGYISTRSEEFRTAEGPAFYLHKNEEFFNWKYPIQKIYNKEYSLLKIGYSPFDEKKPLRTILVNTTNGELTHSGIYKYIGLWKDTIIITVEITPQDFQSIVYINEIK